MLFLLTAKYHAAILEFVPGEEEGAPGRVETRAHGNVADRVGRPSETGILIDVDVANQLIALRLYEGVLKVSAHCQGAASTQIWSSILYSNLSSGVLKVMA